MNIEDLNNSELIENYSKILGLLKKRGVIRTKNLIGDLGEYLAIDCYNNNTKLPNLQVAPPGTQNIDAISRKGERYSIKSSSGNLTGVFYGLNSPEDDNTDEKKFEYVIIVCFDSDFRLSKILELNWNQFLNHKKWHKTMRAWNLSLNKKLISDSKIVYEN